MGVSLKLVSLNIERHKNLDAVERFLMERMPDVVCLQELFEAHVERFRQALGGARAVFEPMGLRPDESGTAMGVGIFSRLPVVAYEARYYSGERGVLQESSQSDAATYNNFNRMVLACDVEKGSDCFRIGTTHFTWTPDGQPTDTQRRDVRALLDTLTGMGDVVLTGDFNAPRGGEIFTMLAERYKDNVPPHYTSSIDPNLHRAGRLELMVDGIFSTPRYSVSDVGMVSGVSDHCALVATVSTAAD